MSSYSNDNTTMETTTTREDRLGYNNNTLKIVVGAFITSVAWICLLFTLIVFFAIFKSGQLKKDTINMLATLYCWTTAIYEDSYT
uniref:Uncharacterized protein n=1 Tax=Acrobeloides nanus TaxID=290746 RepID=A0A914D360_9BILA